MVLFKQTSRGGVDISLQGSQASEFPLGEHGILLVGDNLRVPRLEFMRRSTGFMELYGRGVEVKTPLGDLLMSLTVPELYNGIAGFGSVLGGGEGGGGVTHSE